MKMFDVGLITPGLLTYKLIYCIHLQMHMCIYKVLLWFLSFTLVSSTFTSFFFYVLTFMMYSLVFQLSIHILSC